MTMKSNRSHRYLLEFVRTIDGSSELEIAEVLDEKDFDETKWNNVSPSYLKELDEIDAYAGVRNFRTLESKWNRMDPDRLDILDPIEATDKMWNFGILHGLAEFGVEDRKSRFEVEDDYLGLVTHLFDDLDGQDERKTEDICSESKFLKSEPLKLECLKSEPSSPKFCIRSASNSKAKNLKDSKGGATTSVITSSKRVPRRSRIVFSRSYPFKDEVAAVKENPLEMDERSPGSSELDKLSGRVESEKLSCSLPTRQVKSGKTLAHEMKMDAYRANQVLFQTKSEKPVKSQKPGQQEEKSEKTLQHEAKMKARQAQMKKQEASKTGKTVVRKSLHGISSQINLQKVENLIRRGTQPALPGPPQARQEQQNHQNSQGQQTTRNPLDESLPKATPCDDMKIKCKTKTKQSKQTRDPTPHEILNRMINSGKDDCVAFRSILVDCGDISPKLATEMLWRCCKRNSVGCARLLIDEFDAEVLYSNKKHTTALHVAAHCGDIQMVKLLLQKNGFNTSPNFRHETPAQTAIRRGHKEVTHYIERFRRSLQESSWETVRRVLTPEEKLQKKARVILNKITQDNYSAPKNDMLELLRSEVQHTQPIARALVERVEQCDEPLFLYADLSTEIIKECSILICRKKLGGCCNIWKHILQEWEIRYRSFLNLEPSTKIGAREHVRRRSLKNNVLFLGELYRKSIAKLELILFILNSLFQHQEMEILCAFLTAHGSAFDENFDLHKYVRRLQKFKCANVGIKNKIAEVAQLSRTWLLVDDQKNECFRGDVTSNPTYPPEHRPLVPNETHVSKQRHVSMQTHLPKSADVTTDSDKGREPTLSAIAGSGIGYLGAENVGPGAKDLGAESVESGVKDLGAQNVGSCVKDLGAESVVSGVRYLGERKTEPPSESTEPFNPAPSGISDDGTENELCCPEGHGLLHFTAPVDDRFTCNCCGISQKAGASLSGCNICDFDACYACYARASLETTEDKRWKLVEWMLELGYMSIFVYFLW